MEITIFNIEGEKLLQFETSQTKAVFNISSLADGIYTILCKSRDEVKTFKISVIK